MKKKIGLVFLTLLVLILCVGVLFSSLSCATTKGGKGQAGAKLGLKGERQGREGGENSGRWFWDIASAVQTQEIIGGVIVIIIVGASLLVIKKIVSRKRQ